MMVYQPQSHVSLLRRGWSRASLAVYQFSQNRHCVLQEVCDTSELLRAKFLQYLDAIVLP